SQPRARPLAPQQGRQLRRPRLSRRDRRGHDRSGNEPDPRRRGVSACPGCTVTPLEAVLSPDGWPYASSQPIASDDPGRYHALFGRDSLITALQVLPERPDVARATLRALTSLQGIADDPETDEEPGKIVHEYRPHAEKRFEDMGWPVRHGELRYYGSAD